MGRMGGFDFRKTHPVINQNMLNKKKNKTLKRVIHYIEYNIKAFHYYDNFIRILLLGV